MIKKPLTFHKKKGVLSLMFGDRFVSALSSIDWKLQDSDDSEASPDSYISTLAPREVRLQKRLEFEKSRRSAVQEEKDYQQTIYTDLVESLGIETLRVTRDQKQTIIGIMQSPPSKPHMEQLIRVLASPTLNPQAQDVRTYAVLASAETQDSPRKLVEESSKFHTTAIIANIRPLLEKLLERHVAADVAVSDTLAASNTSNSLGASRGYAEALLEAETRDKTLVFSELAGGDMEKDVAGEGPVSGEGSVSGEDMEEGDTLLLFFACMSMPLLLDQC
jgi:hypothetical protein